MDKILLTLAILIAGGGLTLLNFTYLIDQYFSYRTVQLRQIGKVDVASRGVKRKSGVDLVWTSARKLSPAYEYDSFYTGADDEMAIEMTDGGRIYLGPNTLLRLQSVQSETLLELKSGSTKIRLGNKGSVKISGGAAQKYKVQAKPKAEIIVQANSKVLEVSSKSTESVKLTPKTGAEITINKGEALIVEPDVVTGRKVSMMQKVEDLVPPKLLFPIESQMQVEPKKELPVVFRWLPSRSFDQYRLQISSSPDMKLLTVDRKFTDQDYTTIPLLSGEYYWRMVAQKAGSTTKDDHISKTVPSDVAHFSIQESHPTSVEEPPAEEDPPEEILAKADEIPVLAIPTIESNPRTITLKYQRLSGHRLRLLNPPIFKWNIASEKTEPIKMRLQVFANKLGTKPLFQTETVANEFTWKGAIPGRFLWRVAQVPDPAMVVAREPSTTGIDTAPSQVPNQEALQWSEIGDLRLNLDAPTWSEPIKRYTFQVKSKNETEKGGESLSAQWNSVPGARGYAVQLSRDEKFDDAKPVLVGSNGFQFQPKTTGTYFVKVAVANRGGQLQSPYSGPLKIEYTKTWSIPAPSLISPPNKARLVVFSKEEVKTVIFTWSLVDGADEYEFSLGTDQSFSMENGATKLYKVKGSSQSIEIEKPGRYFWRVRAKAEKQSSQWSQPKLLTVGL